MMIIVAVIIKTIPLNTNFVRNLYLPFRLDKGRWNLLWSRQDTFLRSDIRRVCTMKMRNYLKIKKIIIQIVNVVVVH